MIALLFTAAFSLSCYDQNDKPVSFLSIIKYPGKTHGSQEYTYSFFTSRNHLMQLESQQVDANGGPLYNTITNAQRKKGKFLVWNDEVPGKKSVTYNAHAKGILYFDESNDEGFLLVHSVPGWPRIAENGEIQVPLDDEKKIYGQ